MRRLTRRESIARGAAGLAGVAALAGCIGGGSGGDASGDGGAAGSSGDDATDTATPTPTPTPSPTATSTPVPGGRVQVDADALGGHASARGIRDQPVLGDVASATGVVLAFEDPSCPRCAEFERRTARRIRQELVPSGQAAYVVRTAPLVYPWGREAIAALEVVFVRDADAFWGLLDFYFTAQSGISSENVRSRTRSYLAEETDLDAEGVMTAVDEGEGLDAVMLDSDVAREAGVRGTPTVFLFRDGSYRTKASGSVSYELVTGALGL
jgi:protein-disulfide isomerase